MARLRKFVAYRRLGRPYTRVSKFRAKSYIRTNPRSLVVRYDMGDPKKNFDYTLTLAAKQDLNIRDNALESARQTSLKLLEPIGANNFYFRLRVYPFQILRENPLAAGAGADRFSTGMQKAFGKPTGQAARIKKGHVIFEARVDKANVNLAKKALTRAKTKLPCSCRIEAKEKKII